MKKAMLSLWKTFLHAIGYWLISLAYDDVEQPPIYTIYFKHGTSKMLQLLSYNLLVQHTKLVAS